MKGGILQYIVYTWEGQKSFDSLAEAKRYAKKLAKEHRLPVFVENRFTGQRWEF